MRFISFAYCLLSWFFHSSILMTVTTSADTDNTARILNIQSKLLKMQTDIVPINVAIAIGDNLEKASQQLDSFGEELQRLKERIVDARGLGASILNNHYNAINAQLDNLKLTLKEKKQAAGKSHLPAEIIALIKDQKFKLAENKLLEMNNSDEIPKIVHTVYAHSSDNFRILVDFARALSSIDLSYYVLVALNKEMLENNHKKPLKMLTLVETMESEVIEKDNVGPDMKTNAKHLVNQILERIQAATEDTIKKSIKNGKFDQAGTIDSLANAIITYRLEMFDEILQRIVSDTYGLVPSKKIIDHIMSYSNIEATATGLSALYSKIKSAGNLNTDVTLNLASQLRNLQLNTNYTEISQKKQDSIEKIIENIPTCARNLYFHPSFCFWNRAKEEYIYAANSTYNYDATRRSVFSGDAIPQSHWHAEQIGTNFYFKNRDYANEYLYAANFNFNADLRYVLTWIPGNNTDQQSAWSIELDGDYCYLKSVYFNQYLFASNLVNPEAMDARYVFTWQPGTSVRRTEFQWQLRHCN